MRPKRELKLPNGIFAAARGYKDPEGACAPLTVKMTREEVAEANQRVATGSEAAASVRKQANKWSGEPRAKLFEQGMQIIYRGPGPAATKIRS